MWSSERRGPLPLGFCALAAPAVVPQVLVDWLLV